MILALAGLAAAHATIPGIDGIANGFLHPLATPAHLLLLLALGLSAGQSAPADGPPAPLRYFAPAAALGLLVAASIGRGPLPAPILPALSLLVGALVAAERPLAPGARAALWVFAGALVALDSPPEMGTLLARGKALLGTWLGMIAVVFYVPFYIQLGREKPWVRVGTRVIGSWILAISLMVLALRLR